MVLHHDTPHALRWLRAGHRHFHNSLAAVLAVGALALLAGTVRVVDTAVAGSAFRPPAQVQVQAQAQAQAQQDVSVESARAESTGNDRSASAMTVDFMELPPASVDAITL